MKIFIIFLAAGALLLCCSQPSYSEVPEAAAQDCVRTPAETPKQDEIEKRDAYTGAEPVKDFKPDKMGTEQRKQNNTIKTYPEFDKRKEALETERQEERNPD